MPAKALLFLEQSPDVVLRRNGDERIEPAATEPKGQLIARSSWLYRAKEQVNPKCDSPALFVFHWDYQRLRS